MNILCWLTIKNVFIITIKNKETTEVEMDTKIDINMYLEKYGEEKVYKALNLLLTQDIEAVSSQAEKEQLGKYLIFDDDVNKSLALMKKLEIDPDLLRSVICIEINFFESSYFNINLNLGYSSATELRLHAIIGNLSKNKYLNTQDIIFYAHNKIIIIKSFIPSIKLPLIYLALDKICHSLCEGLLYSNVTYSMAYGNGYSNVSQIKHSYNEASENIYIGNKAGLSTNLYNIENIFFENIYQYLNPQIYSKLIEINLQKLTKKDGSLQTELLHCAESFIDNCMNIADTSKKSFLHRNTINTRLKKLKNLTDLDPASSFTDAFIIKMMCMSLKNKNTNEDNAHEKNAPKPL